MKKYMRNMTLCSCQLFLSYFKMKHAIAVLLCVARCCDMLWCVFITIFMTENSSEFCTRNVQKKFFKSKQ